MIRLKKLFIFSIFALTTTSAVRANDVDKKILPSRTIVEKLTSGENKVRLTKDTVISLSPESEVNHEQVRLAVERIRELMFDDTYLLGLESSRFAKSRNRIAADMRLMGIRQPTHEQLVGEATLYSQPIEIELKLKKDSSPKSKVSIDYDNKSKFSFTLPSDSDSWNIDEEIARVPYFSAVRRDILKNDLKLFRDFNKEIQAETSQPHNAEDEAPKTH